MDRRKVFISFLGSNNYAECRYASGAFLSQPVRYIQEAMLDMLSRSGEWGKGDVAYILLTEGAERANWLDNGHVDRETKQPIMQAGLESRLALLEAAMTVETVRELPNGNSEQEILEIFRRVYSLLRTGDELYLDVTHGFRYLPMLFNALGAYSKSLLGCSVASISYGNYEGRDTGTNTAQIIDLHALSALQEWTLAADSFVRHGDASDLAALSAKSLNPMLKESRGANQSARDLKNAVNALQLVVDDMRTCRGINITNATSIANL